MMEILNDFYKEYFKSKGVDYKCYLGFITFIIKLIDRLLLILLSIKNPFL